METLFRIGPKSAWRGSGRKKSINLSQSLTHFLSYGGLLAGFGNFTGTNVVLAVMLAVMLGVLAPPPVNWNLLKVHKNIGMTHSLLCFQKTPKFSPAARYWQPTNPQNFRLRRKSFFGCILIGRFPPIFDPPGGKTFIVPPYPDPLGGKIKRGSPQPWGEKIHPWSGQLSTNPRHTVSDPL